MLEQQVSSVLHLSDLRRREGGGSTGGLQDLLGRLDGTKRPALSAEARTMRERLERRRCAARLRVRRLRSGSDEDGDGDGNRLHVSRKAEIRLWGGGRQPETRQELQVDLHRGDVPHQLPSGVHGSTRRGLLRAWKLLL